MHVCDVYVTCICSATVGDMEEWLLCVCDVACVVCMCWCGSSILTTPRTELVRQKETTLQSHLVLGSHSVSYFSHFLLVFPNIIDNTNLYSRWLSQRSFRGKKTMVPGV